MLRLSNASAAPSAGTRATGDGVAVPGTELRDDPADWSAAGLVGGGGTRTDGADHSGAASITGGGGIDVAVAVVRL